MELIIGLIGTAASLLGAAYSYLQARSAKSAESMAVKARDEIVAKYEDYENAQARRDLLVSIQKLNQLRRPEQTFSAMGLSVEAEISKTLEILHTLMAQKIYLNQSIKSAVDTALTALEGFDPAQRDRYLNSAIHALAEIARIIDSQVRK